MLFKHCGETWVCRFEGANLCPQEAEERPRRTLLGNSNSMALMRQILWKASSPSPKKGLRGGAVVGWSC